MGIVQADSSGTPPALCDTCGMSIVALTGILAYLLGAFWLRPASGTAGADAQAGATPKGGADLSRLGWVAGGVGIAAHLLLQLDNLRAAGGIDLHFFAALSWVGLALAIATGLLALRRDFGVLGVFVLPLAALTLALDAGYGHPAVSSSVTDWRIALHAWMALLAYATLTVSALIAVCVWLQDRALRTRRFSPLSRHLPPLTLTEQLLFRLIAAGFVLLTLTILTGALFVEDMMAQHLAHKTVLTLLSWLVFGVLLYGRWRHGWRGPRAVRFTLWGFGLLVLAFFGTKFVLELVLQRA